MPRRKAKSADKYACWRVNWFSHCRSRPPAESGFGKNSSGDFPPRSDAAGRAGLQPRRNRGPSGLSVPFPEQLAAASCSGKGTRGCFASPCGGGAEAPPFPAPGDKSGLVGSACSLVCCAGADIWETEGSQINTTVAKGSVRFFNVVSPLSGLFLQSITLRPHIDGARDVHSACSAARPAGRIQNSRFKIPEKASPRCREIRK